MTLNRLVFAVGCLVLLVGSLLVASSLSARLRADAATDRAQSQLATDLERRFDVRRSAAGEVLSRTGRTPPSVAQPVGTGLPLVRMTIPRFGDEWSWIALEGTSPDILAQGPGHYRGTALPGARGNSAFAAHRAGHGDPFLDFDELQPGDEVLLEQGNASWTYRLTTAPRIIDVDATWVIDPVAGEVLTLTTCWPTYGSDRRMYVRGRLVS